MDEAICHIHAGRPCGGFRGLPAASMAGRKIRGMGGRGFPTADCLCVRLSSIARDVVCGLAAVRQDAPLAKDRDPGLGWVRGEHRDAADLVARPGSSSPTLDLWNRWSRSGGTLLVVGGYGWIGLGTYSLTICRAGCSRVVNIDRNRRARNAPGMPSARRQCGTRRDIVGII